MTQVTRRNIVRSSLAFLDSFICSKIVRITNFKGPEAKNTLLFDANDFSSIMCNLCFFEIQANEQVINLFTSIVKHVISIT